MVDITQEDHAYIVRNCVFSSCKVIAAIKAINLLMMIIINQMVKLIRIITDTIAKPSAIK